MTVFVMSPLKFLSVIKKKYLHVKNIYDIICKAQKLKNTYTD